LRELLIDEILLYHNKDARKYYHETKKNNPNGVLEIIYQRVEENSSSACKGPSEIESDSTSSSVNNSPPQNDKDGSNPNAPNSQSSVA
jgi:hypothetical protein